MPRVLCLLLPLIALPGRAAAHASEQAVVLLLPTGFYVAGGVASVVLTVLLVSVLPDRWALSLFRPLALGRSGGRGGAGPLWTSAAVFLALGLLCVIGEIGPETPVRNPLPQAVWTVFWVAIVLWQGIVGDIWRWVNPWSGPYALVRRLGARPLLRYPRWLGHWPGLASFLAFAAVLLAHPAPADPDQLAPMVAIYWAVHFAGMVVFGPKWRRRAEGLTVLMTNYARLAAVSKARGRWRLGLPGWRYLRFAPPPVALAVTMLVALAVGSFDGLNETFLWLGWIGQNPLEFGGRSAVVAQNLWGLVGACAALTAVFAATVWLGAQLAGAPGTFATSFRRLAPAILPIALGYHFAHYMPSFLVDIQYTIRTASDPLGLGWNLFGTAGLYVTTGFFNTVDTVRVIFLAEAGAVVIGHVVAIAMSHALAVGLHRSHRKAAISQIPLATFMVAYTLFGLWLLASPRGA
ncbi:hypothetical protein [Acidimangrovimonas sediminis]|uniref:hypothetical protein n=1 Tax=Acidimangrovimonas sediminis TaxID=2056283 RepID=UPI000C80DB4F|nr:hypothetical protein [Acidimangrovimonas sediminis]